MQARRVSLEMDRDKGGAESAESPKKTEGETEEGSTNRERQWDGSPYVET